MVNKKKFHGGYGLLFGVLLCLLLGLQSSICYASTEMPADKIEYMVDNFFFRDSSQYNQKVFNTLYANSGYKNAALMNEEYKQNAIDFFTQAFNNNNDIEFNSNFFDFFAYNAMYSITQNSRLYYYGTIYYTNANMGTGENAHPYIEFASPTSQYIQENIGLYSFTIFYLNDNKERVSQNIRAIDYTYDTENHSFSLRSFRNINASTSNPQHYYQSRMESYWNSNNTNISSISSIAGIVNFYNTNSVYTNYDGTNTFSTPTPKLLLTNYIDNTSSEPENPDTSVDTGETGTIKNNSGDKTGSIDLSGIQSGINNVQNQISGDTQKVIDNQNENTQGIINALSGETEKITNTLTDSADDLIDNTIITSGDIESALNFEIAQDPYSNFWFTLTNNLKSALLGTKRSIDIFFQGETWTISLDEYMTLPSWLVIILTPFSTAFFTWVLVRQIKLIFDKISSGNVDSLLKENSEERYL